MTDRIAISDITLRDGLTGSTLVLGKHSGRHAFIDALGKIGLHLDAAALQGAFARFKELADRKSQITDRDLEALATEEAGEGATLDIWRLDALSVTGGTVAAPHATAWLSRGAEVVESSASGDGMIDAVCNAVAIAVGLPAKLLSFQVAAVAAGSDAVGDVSVAVEVEGTRVTARAVSTDVVEASARAFLHAMNKVVVGTAVPHRTDTP